MLQALPFLSIIAVVAATLLRAVAIRRRTGDRAFAFMSATGIQRIAGVSFALSVAALVLASALPASGSSLAVAVLAAILALVGCFIVIVAQVQMGRAWRVGVRQGDAPLFVTHGLFKFSRNPIFVGTILQGVAAALTANAAWAWAALTVFIGSCAVQVRVEEAHLEASFGQHYREFRASIPRWIGIGGRA